MTIQSKLARPLVVFDIEATGLDIAKDRIVTLGIHKLGNDAAFEFEFKCNPGVKMSDEVIAIHGIANEMCAVWPSFSQQAEEIFSIINSCDLAGYNLLNFDIPLLYEEFSRCDIDWNLDSIRIIDAGNIFKKKEERSLSAAVRFYLEREHASAHDALGDVEATLAVLNAQLARYADLCNMSLDELSAFSRFDDRIDLAGKIVRGADGRPIYNIGKNRGTAVEDDIGFAQWMLRQSFSENTKSCLRGILNNLSHASNADDIPF